jgi:hypothetical protein
MLPYVVYLLLWFLIAAAWPLVESLHALQTASDNRKRWLSYWLLLSALSWFLFYFEWLLRLPFYILTWVCFPDLYYELHLVVMAYMVSQVKLNGLSTVRNAVAARSGNAVAAATGKMLQRLAPAIQEAAKNSRSVQMKNQEDRPGRYYVIKEAGIMQSLQTAKGSVVGKVQVGDWIEVLEVVNVEAEKRIRARIQEPSGWISLMNNESGTRWAVHEDDHKQMQNQMPSLMPQADVFANAAAVGCNPMALFQGASAAPVTGEVSSEDAWEAMAMLESQLARADDFSEDFASRQASQMLKTMLSTLVQSDNEGMLAMTQAMVPELGRIWANEDTRTYLKEYLSTSASGNAPVFSGGSSSVEQPTSSSSSSSSAALASGSGSSSASASA